MQQDNNEKGLPEQELSATWLELLGARVPQPPLPVEATEEAGIPVIETDPWRALLQGKDIALVDLQKISLHAVDQDVERVLRIMQERAEGEQK